jgi:hypothetical protein
MIDASETADHRRVLMVFTQSNIKDATMGKRTGERVKIEELSTRDLPLVYASDLAEHRIKHEVREADDCLQEEICGRCERAIGQRQTCGLSGDKRSSGH